MGAYSMIELLKQEILERGYTLRILSIKRLYELKKDIESFEKNQALNQFQKYILNSIYKFEVPTVDFEIKSIVVIAVPTPAYAKVEFVWQGKKSLLDSLARFNIGGEDAKAVTRKYLKNYLATKGYHIKQAPNLPLKRLAVRSGLAVYGRNNICYVEGMGSFLTLVAYFTDIPFTEDDWTEMRQASICTNCRA